MQYDALIIGAGHNGLVCAWYLARAGLKVRIVEKLPVVGGAAVTEEFHPGFRNSVAAYTVSLLQAQIIRDMDLTRHGLQIINRPMENFLPVDDHNYLLLGGDLASRQKQIAKFSTRDAGQLPAWLDRLERLARLFRGLLLKTPVNADGGVNDLFRLLSDARHLHGLGLQGQRDLLALIAGSAGDMLDRNFDSDPIKAILGFDSIVGSFISPYTPGSGYVLLHHVIGEANGKQGAWGHAIGGMGAITEAMARACMALGVEISVETPVQKVLVNEGKASGIVLKTGDTLFAKRIVSNLNPRLLYTRLVDADALDGEFLTHMQHWKCHSASLRMNVALSELPDFSCLPGKQVQPHHGAGIIIGPSLQYMEQAYIDAKQNGWSGRPVVELVIPSTYDPTLAPAGKHVASLFCQHFAYALPDGRDWDDAREEVADLVIKTVTDYAPNFRDAVIARSILTPPDLEHRFGLTGGDIFHGALTPEQLYSARPILGHADYRAPIKNLYMCGSGTHPGGGVSGAPGYNAAREILKDTS
ncbi:MAG: NAD(P)/FAD-dependent oxidoreductase [Gammaproteobacteria bacterium]